MNDRIDAWPISGYCSSIIVSVFYRRPTNRRVASCRLVGRPGKKILRECSLPLFYAPKKYRNLQFGRFNPPATIRYQPGSF